MEQIKSFSEGYFRILESSLDPFKVVPKKMMLAFPDFHNFTDLLIQKISPDLMFLKCKIDFFLFLPKGMITLMWKKFWRREMRRDESWKKANFDGGIWSVIFPKSGKEIPQRRMVDHTKTEIPWRVIVHYHRIIQKVNRTRAFVGVPTCLMVQSFPLIHFSNRWWSYCKNIFIVLENWTVNISMMYASIHQCSQSSITSCIQINVPLWIV